MSFQVPNKYRIREGLLGSNDKSGNNGAFRMKIRGIKVKIIASDGGGWEHVSVSRNDQKMPNWQMMCEVKELFWDDEDCVVQYHPPRSLYVNAHDSCLHLWKPTEWDLPMPPTFMVGPKEFIKDDKDYRKEE